MFLLNVLFTTSYVDQCCSCFLQFLSHPALGDLLSEEDQKVSIYLLELESGVVHLFHFSSSISLLIY